MIPNTNPETGFRYGVVALHSLQDWVFDEFFYNGTNLTADCGTVPLNAVIKMTYARRGNGVWYPLIKVSDSVGKTMCKDDKYRDFVLHMVNERVKVA